MRSIKVSEGQTLLDIAMQECGDVAAAFDIAQANGLSLSDDLIIGQELLVPAPTNEQIVEMFLKIYVKPASGENFEDSEVAGEGLGYWRIGEDFIIS